MWRNAGKSEKKKGGRGDINIQKGGKPKKGKGGNLSLRV